LASMGEKLACKRFLLFFKNILHGDKTSETFNSRCTIRPQDLSTICRFTSAISLFQSRCCGKNSQKSKRRLILNKLQRCLRLSEKSSNSWTRRGDLAQQTCNGTTGFYKWRCQAGRGQRPHGSDRFGSKRMRSYSWRSALRSIVPMAPVTPLTAELRNPCYAMGGGHPDGVT
jgi:hypothetical protein